MSSLCNFIPYPTVCTYGVQYPGQRLQLYLFDMGNMEFSIDDVIISKGLLGLNE